MKTDVMCKLKIRQLTEKFDVAVFEDDIIIGVVSTLCDFYDILCQVKFLKLENIKISYIEDGITYVEPITIDGRVKRYPPYLLYQEQLDYLIDWGYDYEKKMR